MKQMKCCCCPDCRVNPGKCCKCIPSTICVTFTDPYGNECSVELDWDKAEKHFTGTLSCDGESIDLLFYFEAGDEYDDNCYFKLRSDTLGFPDGYEHQWILGYEIECDTLEAGITFDDGTSLAFAAVRKITPTECRGCKCLCECICVTATRADGIIFTGKLCWSEYGGDEYTGTLTSQNSDDEPAVTVRFIPRGEVCDPADYDCDPYDDSCVIAISIPDWGVEDQWDDIDPADCRERGITHHWDLPYGASADIVCATCNQECTPSVCDSPCHDCKFPALPTSLHVSGSMTCHDGGSFTFEGEILRGAGSCQFCGEMPVSIPGGCMVMVLLDIGRCRAFFHSTVNDIVGEGCGGNIDNIFTLSAGGPITINSCDPVDISFSQVVPDGIEVEGGFAPCTVCAVDDMTGNKSGWDTNITFTE